MLIVGLHCRAYPDEKGIETDGICQDAKNYWFPIAEPIPMKRELKLGASARYEMYRGNILQSLSR